MLRLVVTFDSDDDRDLPIDFASAVIGQYMGDPHSNFIDEEDRQIRLSRLEEVAEHILTFVNHAK